MLCERCHEREATVHVTNIFGETGETKKQEFCEACATDSEGGRISSRASKDSSASRFTSSIPGGSALHSTM
jgi:protein-arginine kinase activator protein McsA